MFVSLSLTLSSYLVHCCSTLFHLPLALPLALQLPTALFLTRDTPRQYENEKEEEEGGRDWWWKESKSGVKGVWR